MAFYRFMVISTGFIVLLSGQGLGAMEPKEGKEETNKGTPVKAVLSEGDVHHLENMKTLVFSKEKWVDFFKNNPGYQQKVETSMLTQLPYNKYAYANPNMMYPIACRYSAHRVFDQEFQEAVKKARKDGKSPFFLSE